VKLPGLDQGPLDGACRSRLSLDWCSRLQAIAQNGLTFTRDPYDTERYTAIREIAAEMLASITSGNVAAVRAWMARDEGYATPKVDVRGVVFHEGKLLMVREKSDGKWTLPGGWADVNASPAENVVREIREEAGFETRVTRLLALFDRSQHPHEPAFPHHVYKLFMECEIIGGSASASLETDEVGFFSEAEIPELSLTRVTPWQIRRMFAHQRDPGMHTEFDPVK